MSKILGLNVSLYISPLAQKGKFIQIKQPFARLESLGRDQLRFFSGTSICSFFEKKLTLVHTIIHESIVSYQFQIRKKVIFLDQIPGAVELYV